MYGNDAIITTNREEWEIEYYHTQTEEEKSQEEELEKKRMRVVEEKRHQLYEELKKEFGDT